MEKTLKLLGMCQRGGNIVSGEDMVISAIKSGKAVLVILAVDASENTAKKIINSSNFYKVPLILLADKYALGVALGKSERSSAAITNKGLAEAVLKLKGV